MEVRFVIYLIPYVLALAVTLGISLYAWRHRFMPGITAFAVAMACEALWIFGNIGKLASPSLEGKIFWDNVEYIGTLFAPIALLFFARLYAGNKVAHPVREAVLLSILPAISLLLLFTNAGHGLIRDNSAQLVIIPPFDSLLYDFTGAMWVMFIYSYAIYFWAIVILIRHFLRQHRFYRIQAGLILLGVLIPVIGTILTFTEIRFVGQRDWSSLFFRWEISFWPGAFSVTACSMWCLWRGMP